MLQSSGLGKFPLAVGHWNDPGDDVVVVATGVVSLQETKSGEVHISVTGSKIESPGQVRV